MTEGQAAVVAAARACLGARFRLHGRDPSHGLDCVGLVARAYALSDVPAGYRLRGGREEAVLAALDRLGFRDAEGASPADLLLLRPGPFQLHLAIATASGFVHADAGLRRVVEVPGLPRWPLVARRHRPRG
ncbi:peptidoglycan endopeptidase [Sphingomonas sp.]|uniref:peptidoglycan endopeptidase n=1 Tax=Sphingomonas sp. TaxID=28214 RepID=UPI003AFF9663